MDTTISVKVSGRGALAGVPAPNEKVVKVLSELGDYGIIHGGNLPARVVASKAPDTHENDKTTEYA